MKKNNKYYIINVINAKPTSRFLQRSIGVKKKLNAIFVYKKNLENLNFLKLWKVFSN